MTDYRAYPADIAEVFAYLEENGRQLERVIAEMRAEIAARDDEWRSGLMRRLVGVWR